MNQDKMNKYLIISTDDRSYLDLKNLSIELRSRNLPYFFLYSNTSHRVSPQTNLEDFFHDTNIEFKEKTYFSKTLGMHLPFKPNVLLITNENWEPEKTILWEFKQWGCFIGCVENASRIYVNPKSSLELECRKAFPTNCIDVFFDHSEWAKESKVLSGWFPSKSIVTGNPRNDNLNLKVDDLIGENKIIIYGSMEREHHNILLNIYKNLNKKLKDWEIYYKTHPSEIKDFPQDFNNIKTLSTYDEYFKILPKSHHHIGIFSSVMYFPLVLDKNIIYVDAKTSGMQDELNIENYKGHEFNFWSRVFANEIVGSGGFKDFKEFHDFIGDDFIENMKKRNKSMEEHIENNLVLYQKDLTFLNKKSNNYNVFKYFDEFGDGKASERIINYIEHGKKVF